MEESDSGSDSGRYIKVLIATNAVTLAALIATIIMLLNQPAALPEPERMQQMIEAQDWLIGKMSEKLWKQNVELVKLEFGLENDDPSDELEVLLEQIKQYDGTRREWSRDLDDSRRRMEVRYSESVENAESPSSDPASPHMPDSIATDEKNDE